MIADESLQHTDYNMEGEDLMLAILSAQKRNRYNGDSSYQFIVGSAGEKGYSRLQCTIQTGLSVITPNLTPINTLTT